MAAPIIGARAALRDAIRTKSGLFGFSMLAFTVGVVVVIPFVAPYDVVRTWVDVAAWTDNPRNAGPDWIDAFDERKQARNIILDWGAFSRGESNTSQNLKIIILQGRWEFPYHTFPSAYRLQIRATWAVNPIQIQVEWIRPDRESLVIFEGLVTREAPEIDVLPITADDPRNDPQTRVRDWALSLGADDVDNLRDVRPFVTLYAEQGAGMLHVNRATVLQGPYALRITGLARNVTDTLEARFISYGKVFGLVGTDHLGRDLFVGIIWGAPVALAFGGAAASLTVLAQVVFGAFGAYYGRRADEVVQRAADFFIIIPVLPILILIGQLYQVTILAILGVVVLFNIVGGTTKVVRSLTLQTREELYVEAARSYGAPRRRILFRYIIPRALPYTFALLALNVPAFIFLEASLSFLGLGDQNIPTWGSIMGEASRNGALYNGLWWWIAFPAAGIVFTTVAFAFLGYAFDKVLNPRLREE
jgi:peptide/nickel transport system permease protein